MAGMAGKSEAKYFKNVFARVDQGPEKKSNAKAFLEPYWTILHNLQV